MVESTKNRSVGCKDIELGSDLHTGLFNPCRVVVKLPDIALLELITNICPYILTGFKVYKLAVALKRKNFFRGIENLYNDKVVVGSRYRAVSIDSGSCIKSEIRITRDLDLIPRRQFITASPIEVSPESSSSLSRSIARIRFFLPLRGLLM